TRTTPRWLPLVRGSSAFPRRGRHYFPGLVAGGGLRDGRRADAGPLRERAAVAAEPTLRRVLRPARRRVLPLLLPAVDRQVEQLQRRHHRLDPAAVRVIRLEHPVADPQVAA